MPKIDNIIKKAILDAAQKYGSQAKVAAAVGITPAALSRYLNGQVITINAATWNILLPVIKEFLPDEYLSRLGADVKSECSEELIARAYLRGSIDTLLWYSRIKVCAEIAAELEGILTRVQTGQITAETAKAEIKAFFHNGGQSLADFLKQAEAARMALLNSNNHKEERRDAEI